MNIKTKNINPLYSVLLCLIVVALLIDLGSGVWFYKKTIAFTIAMLLLLYINYKWWLPAILSLAAYIITEATKFPRLANHSNLETGVLITILCIVILKLLGYKLKKPHSAEISFILRLILITIYFIAGFHKLNSGFFMTEGSCIKSVNIFFSPLLLGDTFITSPTVLRLMQISTILIEMVLPFGLLFAKSRKFVAWALVMFHFYLSLCNFSNFSAFAGFLITACILDFSKNNIHFKLIRALRIYIAFSILSVIISYIIRRYQLVNSDLYRMCNGVIFNIGWVLFFVTLLKDKDIFDRENNVIKLSAKQFIPTVVILLWGMQNYVGLSTTGNLTMFSNLITEKSRTNHYIINTRYTKIWNFEEDYVTVLNMTGTHTDRSNLVNYDIPLIEFKFRMKRLIQYRKDKISCTILYRGQKIYIPDMSKSKFSQTKWWYRFIQYRKIPHDGTNECMW
ncbi:hypothetical protein [Flavobacterium rhizosphaerae]|uniref:HTTM domain-containing protein n=1 Tax=Flavobacterium rhizosphaerae TaxID=3163298 RepID=A0ABW8Z091_9FLAO